MSKRKSRRQQLLQRPHRRRMQVESLEDRRMLAITVDTHYDVVDPLDGVVSLREAISLASPSETIEFSLSSQFIFLDGGGELVINKPLTIQGPGSNQLTLIRVGDQLRHFRIDDGNGNVNASVTLSGMTLVGADMNGDGGAILSHEALTLVDLVVTNNTASGSGGGVWSSGPTTLIDTSLNNNQAGGNGGGLWVTGNLTIDSGEIHQNIAGIDGGGLWVDGPTDLSSVIITGNTSGDDGGGILASGGLTISDSVLEGNATTDDGGGLLSLGETTIQNSTIADNSAEDDGGGLWIQGNLNVIGSTLSGNSAVDTGGGLYFRPGNALFTNATISGNRVTGEYGLGGGIFTRGALTLISSTVTLNEATAPTGLAGGLWDDNDPIQIESSIIAENIAGLGYPDMRPGSGTLAVMYSIIGDTAGLSSQELADINAGTGNLINIDPLLGPLADNGGPTLTHALLAGSPAIDFGGTTAQLFDQRGAPYTRLSDGNNDGQAALDAGALEVQQRAFVVDTMTDEADGNYEPGDFSLREAILLANAETGMQSIVITFAAHLNGAVIQLSDSLGQLSLSRDMKVDATGLASGVTIDAGHGVDNLPRTGDGFRIFTVGVGATVELVNLTLTGGDVLGSLGNGGGAILSKGQVSLRHSTVTGNATTGDRASGGGIAGNVTLIDSRVSNNSTSGNRAHGGGLFSEFKTDVINSTISGNFTAGSQANGGGAYVSYFETGSNTFLTLTSSVVSGNSTAGNGEVSRPSTVFVLLTQALLGIPARTTAVAFMSCTEK